MMLKWMLCVCVCLAWWTANTQGHAASHYVYKLRTYNQRYRFYDTCGDGYNDCRMAHGWWWWRRDRTCEWKCVGVWRNAYRVVSTPYRECHEGWRGSRCNIRIAANGTLDHCYECKFVNGIGCVADPTNCHLYYQCVEDEDGTITETHMCCGSHTAWNHEHLACEDDGGLCTDPVDLCRDVEPTSEPIDKK